MPLSRVNYHSLALLALCVGFLSSCAGKPVPLANPPSWAQTEGVRYVCANKKTFVVSFSPRADKAAIKLNDGTLYEASQTSSGSGIRYISDDIEFHGKGRVGELKRSPDGVYPNCKAVD